MKNLITIIILVCSTSVFAGGGKSFEKTMSSSIQTLYDTQELAGFDQIANKFNRILTIYTLEFTLPMPDKLLIALKFALLLAYTVRILCSRNCLHDL